MVEGKNVRRPLLLSLSSTSTSTFQPTSPNAQLKQDSFLLADALALESERWGEGNKGRPRM